MYKIIMSIKTYAINLRIFFILNNSRFEKKLQIKIVFKNVIEKNKGNVSSTQTTIVTFFRTCLASLWNVSSYSPRITYFARHFYNHKKILFSIKQFVFQQLDCINSKCKYWLSRQLFLWQNCRWKLAIYNQVYLFGLIIHT